MQNADTCRPLFSENKLYTLTNIYIYEALIYMHNNINFISSNEIHTYGIRFNRIRQFQCTNNIIYTSFLNTSIKLYNTLDNSVKNESQRYIKKYLKENILRNVFYDLSEFFKKY